MKVKIKKESTGITLVALAVTIVVLLILAGITLGTVIGDNGIIAKAQQAKNKTEQTKSNTEGIINSLEQEMAGSINKTNTENGEKTDESENKVDGVTIPSGYYYVGGTKAKGIVISDNVADKELDKGKEDVRRDLTGNQWVWVPIETPGNLYTTVTEGQLLSGDSGVETTKYTKSEIIKGITRGLPKNTNGFREPDLVLGDGGYYQYDYLMYEKAGFSSYINMAETLVNDYDDMIASLVKYKGFYIGRYELSENGEKIGATQTNKTWYELYKNCTKLAKEDSNVKTRMIWGLQWDATCKWLDSSGFYITDSSKWGNCGNNTATGAGEKQNTGSSEMWKANNIYDFAGNCVEWTQEAYTTSSRAARGTAAGSNSNVIDQGYNLPTNPNSMYCTRATLYLAS